jgi:hypothetical protein
VLLIVAVIAIPAKSSIELTEFSAFPVSIHSSSPALAVAKVAPHLTPLFVLIISTLHFAQKSTL